LFAKGGIGICAGHRDALCFTLNCINLVWSWGRRGHCRGSEGFGRSGFGFGALRCAP
jgi:hypothetical protein